jgi:hypothetical protein
MQDFVITFSDLPDKSIWSYEQVRCRSDDEDTGLTGKWDSASNHDDVFGPGTGNHGWYTWRPNQGLLFLNRPGANNKGLENSLIRFFNLRGIQHTTDEGLAYVPSPPEKDGKPVKVVYELGIHERLKTTAK